MARAPEDEDVWRGIREGYQVAVHVTARLQYREGEGPNSNDSVRELATAFAARYAWRLERHTKALEIRPFVLVATLGSAQLEDRFELVFETFDQWLHWRQFFSVMHETAEAWANQDLESLAPESILIDSRVHTPQKTLVHPVEQQQREPAPSVPETAERGGKTKEVPYFVTIVAMVGFALVIGTVVGFWVRSQIPSSDPHTISRIERLEGLMLQPRTVEPQMITCPPQQTIIRECPTRRR